MNMKVKENWFGCVHVGLVHFNIYQEIIKGEGPIVEMIQRVAEDDFFTAIEITWIKSEQVRKEVRNVLETSHMEIVFSAGPPILISKVNPNALDENERKKAVDFMKPLIDQAYFFNAKLFPLMTGPDPGEANREKAKEQFVKSMGELCAYAQEKGESNGYTLMIELEPSDREIDKKSLIGPTGEAVEIAKSVQKMGYENFSLNIDGSHLPLLRETPGYALKTAAGYIGHVHIGNCVMKDINSPAYGDQHPRFGIKGGENDIPQVAEFIRQLRETGFLDSKVVTSLPVASLELKTRPGESPELTIANAKRVFKEAWVRAFN